MGWSYCHTDLLLLIFDHMQFDTLFVCLQVSSHWRSVARRHPVFWKRLHVSDATLTPGGIAMFLERLRTSLAIGATIRLAVRCSVLVDQLVGFVLPAICVNMHRIEDLSLVLTPVVASSFSDLFTSSAPMLRRLHVCIKYLGIATWTNLDDFPVMFNLHENKVLESITLVDVPLPSNLPPVQHVVTNVAVYYIHLYPQLRHVTTWLRRTRALEVWSVHPVSSKPKKLEPLPVVCEDLSMPSLNQVSLYCTDWFTVLDNLSLPQKPALVVIRIRRPKPDEVASILPSDGPLCARIGIRYVHPRWNNNAGPWGVIAISSQDRATVRVFEQLSISHMLSTPFLDRVLSQDRLTTLVVSLSVGFNAMCLEERFFPRLETLCICLNCLPEEPEEWTYGKISCPRLKSLAFQRECDITTAILTRRAIDAFIEQALGLPNSATLRVVLADMRMTGSKGRTRGSRISSITHRSIKSWVAETVRMDDT